MAKNRLVSPESLLVYNTPGYFLLAQIPEASEISLFVILATTFPFANLVTAAGNELDKNLVTAAGN